MVNRRQTGKIPIPDLRAAIALADSLRARKPDIVPPEWFTARQMAEQMGASVFTAQRRIRVLIEAGAAEQRKFTIDNRGRIELVPHYRLKK